MVQQQNIFNYLRLQVIEVARLDGSSRKVLIKGLIEPRAVALFLRKG